MNQLECDKLEKIVAKSFQGQVLALGQKILVKLKKTLVLTVLLRCRAVLRQPALLPPNSGH